MQNVTKSEILSKNKQNVFWCCNEYKHNEWKTQKTHVINEVLLNFSRNI